LFVKKIVPVFNSLILDIKKFGHIVGKTDTFEDAQESKESIVEVTDDLKEIEEILFKSDRMLVDDEELLDVDDMVPINLILGKSAKKNKMIARMKRQRTNYLKKRHDSNLSWVKR
jgi:hypothetical protein